MYTMEQAEKLAAKFLHEEYAGKGEEEVALFGDDEHRAQKGEFYYFAWQGTKYIATRDEDHFLYGAVYIEVHGVTGACRFISVHECSSIDPLSHRSR
jgi:hypothetical protein